MFTHAKSRSRAIPMGIASDRDKAWMRQVEVWRERPDCWALVISGQIPTLSIYSAEHRRKRRKQKVNKLTQAAILTGSGWLISAGTGFRGNRQDL